MVALTLGLVLLLPMLGAAQYTVDPRPRPPPTPSRTAPGGGSPPKTTPVPVSPSPLISRLISSRLTTPSPTPTSFPTPLEACQGLPFVDCPRCLPVCEGEAPSAWRDCFNSLSWLMSKWSSECWEHGGNGDDCDNRALDMYCPAK
ncbi:hypothetical protein PG996_006527 [Apiospora saccharicola]|uniref:Uncharacterized protein n=1 Tax=Apiospora saccharicola TaxID=335842 RepID=A0ABR1VAY6_9PEZI